MAPDMKVTFLGTTSGGGPTETRNCSSLVLDALGNGSLWMVDCAEGTVRQFAQQPDGWKRLRLSQLTKIFITHMHADHTMGIITVLRNILGMPKSWSHDHSESSSYRTYTIPSVEIYGPAGIRSFVRTIFNLTHTRSDRHYCVHELLFPHETASAPCGPPELMHENEEAGSDLFPDSEGFWRDIADGSMYNRGGRVTVDAGPIVHRDPCIGYVVREQLVEHQTPGAGNFTGGKLTIVPRCIVILGDTSDPSALVPLIRNEHNDPVSLLIHEATDAYMPPHVDKYGTTGRNRTEHSVQEKAIEKGHSTPAMAGAFARRIRAERLVLNHIGARFPAPPAWPQDGGGWFRQSCMLEIERQATETWRPLDGGKAIASWDFFSMSIPPNPPRLEDSDMELEEVEVVEFVESRVSLDAASHVESSTSRTVTVSHKHYDLSTHAGSSAENNEERRGESNKGRSRHRKPGRRTDSGEGSEGSKRKTHPHPRSRAHDDDSQRREKRRDHDESRKRNSSDTQGSRGRSDHEPLREEKQTVDKRPRK